MLTLQNSNQYVKEIVRYSNEEKLLFILATAFQTVSTQSQVKYTFCSMMKRYGISLEYRRLHQSLLHDLITLNHRHEMGQQKNIMPYVRVSKGGFNMAPIPRAASLGKIRRRGKGSKWIINFLYTLFCGHHHNDPSIPLLEFLS